MGILSTAFENLFGSSGSIVNEPTINYDETMHSKFNQPTQTQKPTNDEVSSGSYRDIFKNENFNESKRNNNIYAGHEYVDVTEEDYIAFDKDLQKAHELHDRTTNKLRSLPSTYRIRNHEISPSENKHSQFCNMKNTRDYMKNEIMQQQNLKFAINNTDQTNEKEVLEKLLAEIKEQNIFLERLSNLIDVTEKESDLFTKYENLYKEYTEELVTCNKFYEAYYKLASNYGEIRKKLSREQINRSAVLESIELIRSCSSNNPRVLKECIKIQQQLNCD